MVPARNLLRRHYDNYGGPNYNIFFGAASNEPISQQHATDHHHQQQQRDIAACSSTMADDASRSAAGDRSHHQDQEDQEEEEEEEEEEAQEAGPSSKDDDEQQRSNWLQLSLGGGCVGRGSSTTSSATPPQQQQPLRELELFPSQNQITVTTTAATAASLTLAAILPSGAGAVMSQAVPFFPPQLPPGMAFQAQQLGTAIRIPPPPLPQSFMYNYGGFVCNPLISPTAAHLGEGSSSSRGGVADAMRVVNPSPRSWAGLWFILRAVENQEKEPILPQIPKSYLRIKDGRITVRLLMKYLVNKLGLDNESEVDMTCRGQQLQPSWTLQHVRDNIWLPREALNLFLPDLPAADHVMTLHYSRSS